MKLKLLQTISWFLISVIIIGVGFYIYNDIYKNQEKIQDIQSENSLHIKDTEKIQYEIKASPIKNKESVSMSIPDLDKPIVFNDIFSDEEKKTITEKISNLIEKLKEDNNLFFNWIELGLYRKSIKDYIGAKDAWEYASKIRPQNNISFANLGNLHHYYLKDFPKAEQNLRSAIENDKQNTGAYTALHELYKYSYKQDTNLAVEVLLEGLKEKPNNTDLLVTLANYYKEKDDIENAQKYHKQALTEAQRLENLQLIKLLEEELSNL